MKRCVMLIALWSLVCWSVSAGDVGKLNVQKNDYDMKSAFARWIDAKKKLEIFAYPFELNEGDKLILQGDDEQAIAGLPLRKDIPVPWTKIIVLFDSKPSGDALGKVKLFAIEVTGLPEEEDVLQKKFEKDKAAKFFNKLNLQVDAPKPLKKDIKDEDLEKELAKAKANEPKLAVTVERVQIQGPVKREPGEPEMIVTAVVNLNIACPIAIPEPTKPPEKTPLPEEKKDDKKKGDKKKDDKKKK